MPPPMTTTRACAGMFMSSSSELQRGNAGDDTNRARQACDAEAFFEKNRADDGSEEDARLAQRGNRGDRRTRHRPEHDAVRRHAAESAEQAPAPLPRDVGDGRGAFAPAYPGEEEDALQEREVDDVRQGVAGRPRAGAVDQRVDADDG